MALSPIQVGKDGSCLPSSIHPSKLGVRSELDTFKNFSIDGRTFLRLLSLRLLIMLFLVMITPGIIVISVGKELSEHLLNVVQAFLLGIGGLLLSFQSLMEVIITVISHMHRHSVRLHRADAKEAYPLASPLSSNHWNKLLNSLGDITLVEEDGCS